MINDALVMNGYGLYVWSAFAFTLLSFIALYVITKIQFVREKNKFIAKFGSLNSERATFAKSQSTIKDILSNASNI